MHLHSMASGIIVYRFVQWGISRTIQKSFYVHNNPNNHLTNPTTTSRCLRLFPLPSFLPSSFLILFTCPPFPSLHRYSFLIIRMQHPLQLPHPPPLLPSRRRLLFMNVPLPTPPNMILLIPRSCPHRSFWYHVCVASHILAILGAEAGGFDVACAATLYERGKLSIYLSFGCCFERGGKAEGERAYTRAVCAIALIAEGAFAHDLAICVCVFIWGDVAGAAAAVGDYGVGGHGFLVGIRRIYMFGGTFSMYCAGVSGIFVRSARYLGVDDLPTM